SAQEQGNETLIDTLGELSRVLRVLESARAILRASLLAAVVAVMVMVATLLAVPGFTVPRLRASFEVIPPEYYGRAIRSLFELSNMIEQVWPWVLPALVLALWLLLQSFGKYVGYLRRYMDALGPWRVYRQVQAL